MMSWPCELIVIADPKLLSERAKQLNLSLQFIECDLSKTPEKHVAGTLNYLPVALAVPVKAGVLNADNAKYVIDTLTLASDLCLSHKADAIVTGPVHKAILNEASIPFRGHTEFFAQRANVKLTVMLFVLREFKVALLTTHLPLSEVARNVTPELLGNTLDIIEKELQNRFDISKPRILVCGLNPHAGENGYLGREEIDIITPTLDALRKKGKNILGPLSADTIFTPKQIANADVVLAMYHDQALPLVKYLGFGDAVNVTLGLPYIRTSVDHGTALELAGTGKADASSLSAAVISAIEMAG